jgi:hypothetical protein
MFTGHEPTERKLQFRLDRAMRHATREFRPRAMGRPRSTPRRQLSSPIWI